MSLRKNQANNIVDKQISSPQDPYASASAPPKPLSLQEAPSPLNVPQNFSNYPSLQQVSIQAGTEDMYGKDGVRSYGDKKSREPLLPNATSRELAQTLGIPPKNQQSVPPASEIKETKETDDERLKSAPFPNNNDVNDVDDQSHPTPQEPEPPTPPKKSIKWRRFLNPFRAALYKGKFEPSSRMRQIDFPERIDDMRRVIGGGTKGIGAGAVSWKEFFRIPSGLFDYATLGLFRVAHAIYSINYYLFHQTQESYRKATGIKKGLLGVGVFLSALPLVITAPINFIGNSLIRPAAAWAIAIPLLLVAGPLHVIFNRKGSSINRSLREDIISTNNDFNEGTKNIFQSLDMRQLTLSRIDNAFFFHKGGEGVPQNYAEVKLNADQMLRLAKINPHTRKFLSDVVKSNPTFFQEKLDGYKPKDFSTEPRRYAPKKGR